MTSISQDQDNVQTPSSKRIAAIELALAVGGFGIGTGEFAIMGLLPDVAKSFSVDLPRAGDFISAYALGVVIGAPLIAVIAAKVSRRNLLLALMAMFSIGNIASACATDYTTFAVLRFLTGFPHGAFFGVASIVAASMVPVHKRTQAVGRVMLGLTMATLVGTPLSTFLGHLLGWRAVFFFIGALGLVSVASLTKLLVRDTVAAGASMLGELQALSRPQVWLTLGVAAVGFAGLFAMFTYIAATITETAGMPVTMISAVMLIFGVGANLSNIVGSRLADRSQNGTIFGVLAVNVIVMTVYGLWASNPVVLCICVFLMSGGFAAGPALQIRLMDAAKDAQTLAAASNHSAFNIANALGASLGGLVIAWGWGYASTGFVGAFLSFLGILIFGASVVLQNADRKRSRTHVHRLIG